MDAGTGRIVAATLTGRGVDDASQVAVLSETAKSAPTQRDRHIQTIAEKGRMTWQRASGYNKRAGVESQMVRWKGALGEALRFHSDQAQATEVAIGVMVLNRMLDLGRPNSVRVA